MRSGQYRLERKISIGVVHTGGLEETARWLVSRGIDQWRPGSFPRQRIAGLTWGVRRYTLPSWVGEPSGVGTLVLQWSDEETWSELPNDTGYVHGLAIRRGFAGRGLGRELLRWAEERIAISG
jgi:ribosomal protein S18 acetylase RimI-like enzyme